MRRTLLTVALSIVIAIPAFAQQPLKLSFQDGRVTVDATAVPVRTILNEWGKIGGTKIVGADRISGAPLTVKLVNVTEAQALETILRSVAGYMAAPRNASTTGPSIYDRILVMATTSAPAPSNAAVRPSSPPQPNAFTGTQRFTPARQRSEQAEQQEPEEQDDNPPSPPVFTFPQPGQNGPPQNGFPQPANFNGAPPNSSQPPQTMQPGQTITINPAQGAPGQPTMPIGVAQPGMMVPAPPPQPPPPQPGMIRPPGGK
jgi:hypothetical protein